MSKNIVKKLKYLFLFFIYSAIILSGTFVGPDELYAYGKASSFLFRALGARLLTAEVYLLSNVRCGIENASRPLDYSENLKPVWKDLRVDAGSLEDVFLIIEPLDPTELFCTHNGLWFEFREDSPVSDGGGYKTYGLVCSGQKMKKNKDEEYFLCQFCSKEDYFKLAYYTERNLRLYKLNLTAGQKKALFNNAIKTASGRGANEKYHFIHNNCVNNMFELINTVLPSYQRFNHWLVHRIIFNPVFCATDFNELIFRLHGLIKETLPVFKAGH